MLKTTRLFIAIPLGFTLLVAWFGWSALQAAPPLAAENLRGAGLASALAIEQLAVADPSFQSLSRYSTPDIAYFALIDRQGIVRFHTNRRLIGQARLEPDKERSPGGLSEGRERLGTGEEVYLLRTTIHAEPDEYLLTLALHTYRADQVIRRTQTGVTVISILTTILWGLTIGLYLLLRRGEEHHREMRRREELARLGEMGAILAHEIRNPLAGIKGFAQLLQRTESLEQGRSYAEIIVTQSLRMEALVNDLLALVRVDQGERQPTDLSRLVADCVTLLSLEAAKQQVTITVDGAASPISTSLVVERIIQMVLNLMKNAIQAMPEGGLLQIGLRQQQGCAYLTVSDTGHGIAPDELTQIFAPFWTSKATGTGLGLALCQKVAEEHGGSVRVESSVGLGTKFIVSLPLAS